MTVMDKKKYLTVEEVAQELRVSPDTIWKLLKKKELAGYKVAGAWRIKPGDVEAYLETRKNTNLTENQD